MYILILVWVLCLVHAIFRMKTGGKSKYGPGPYCGDPNMNFDWITATILGIGIIIFLLGICL